MALVDYSSSSDESMPTKVAEKPTRVKLPSAAGLLAGISSDAPLATAGVAAKRKGKDPESATNQSREEQKKSRSGPSPVQRNALLPPQLRRKQANVSTEDLTALRRRTHTKAKAPSQ